MDNWKSRLRAIASEQWKESVALPECVASTLEIVQSDRELSEAIIRDAVEQECATTAATIMRSERAAIVRDQLSERVSVARTRLMDFSLMGGVRLRDACRSDLEKAIANYRAQARTNLERARWLEMVAVRLTGKKTVHEVCSEHELSRLLKKAAGEFREAA